MTLFADKANKLAFPSCALDATGITGVMRIAVTTTAGSSQLPAGMRGKFMIVKAVGCDIQLGVSQGAAGVTVVSNQPSAPGTGHAQAGFTVSNGERLDGVVPTGKPTIPLWLNYVGSAAGFLEVFCSEAVNP